MVVVKHSQLRITMILTVTVILKLCNNDSSAKYKIGIILPLILVTYAKYHEFLIIKTKALEERFLPSWPKTHCVSTYVRICM